MALLGPSSVPNQGTQAATSIAEAVLGRPIKSEMAPKTTVGAIFCSLFIIIKTIISLYSFMVLNVEKYIMYRYMDQNTRALPITTPQINTSSMSCITIGS